MAQKLFICASAASAGENFPSEWAAGDGGFVLADGSDDDLNAVDPGDYSPNTKLHFCLKRLDGSVEVSPAFTLNECYHYVTSVYGAGTAQVTRVNFSSIIPATQAYGDAYTLHIVLTNDAKLTRKSFTVTRTTADFTEDTLCKAFVAAIGTDTDVKVTAADQSGYMTLTSTDVDSFFRVACDDLATGATVTYTTPGVMSRGTEAKVRVMENNDLAVGKGVTNRVMFTTLPTSQVSGTYDLNTFNFRLVGDDKSSANAMKTEDWKLIIAEPAGSDVCGTALVTALANIDIEEIQDRLDDVEGA